MVITAVPFLLPLQFQLAFGWTPLVAGSLVAALFVGNIAIKPATTPMMRRWGIRRVLLVNGLLSVLCFGLLACLSGEFPVALIAGILFLSGALRSIGFTAYNTLAFSDVDSAQLTHASTLHAAVQELAAGLGVAVGALLLGVFTPASHAGGQAYSWTYLTLGLLMMLTIAETLRLPKDAGAGVTRSTG
jgi:MFS family permease